MPSPTARMGTNTALAADLVDLVCWMLQNSRPSHKTCIYVHVPDPIPTQSHVLSHADATNPTITSNLVMKETWQQSTFGPSQLGTLVINFKKTLFGTPEYFLNLLIRPT
jgi:hypothetical protein